MGPIASTLREPFRFTDFIVALVLSDLKDADARARTRNGEGASIAWIMGHLLFYRHRVLSLLGVETGGGYDSFGNGSASDGEGYPTVAKLRSDWSELHAKLDAAFESSSDEQLLAPLPTPDGPHAEKRVLDPLTFFAWHESYHMGAIGLIRVELGYRATSEMATAPPAQD